MYLPNRSTKFPKPPNRAINNFSFPNDLVTSDPDNPTALGRGFYTDLSIMDYSFSTQLTGTSVLQYAGGMKLPLPKKINDLQTLVWQDLSFLSSAAEIARGAVAAGLGSKLGLAGSTFDQLIGGGAIGSAVAAAAGIGGVWQGLAINPFLFMQFKQANFKEHTLQWTLSPNTPQESETLKEMINTLKKASLPERSGVAVMKYPQIVLPKLHPDDSFTMKFRPCAVLAVHVDYSAAPTLSFFKDTGAPTMVNLTLYLKEIQLWDKINYDDFA